MHLVCPHCQTVNRLPPDKSPLAGRCGRCHQALFSGQPVELTADSFQRHLERGDIPLVVDFWADWCGPCKIMAPVFQRAAAALEPQARFAKVDTERESQLAGRFAIRGIPTLILFKEGREAARTAGAMDLNGLLAWLRGRL